MKRFYIIFSFLLLFAVAAFAQTWTTDNFQVTLKNNIVYVAADGVPITEIDAIKFNFIRPISMTATENNADALVIEAVYPPEVYHNTTDKKGIASIKITKVKNGLRFYSNPKWANQVTIQMRDQNEHYFGLLEKLYPDNKKKTDLRGAVVPFDVESQGNRYYENYASATSAFFISSRGYGSFFDTFRRGQYKLAVNGVTEIYHETGTLDWYLFYGPEGEKIHEGYYSVIGKPKYVPLWACGPVVWRDENKGGKDEILQDMKKMTDMKIPLTCWMVDRPYSNGAHEWSKMDFNSKFAHPEKWIKTINEKYGLQLLTWVAPMTFADRDFPGLLPNYKGYMDLTNPAAVAEFEKRLRDNQYAFNVRGHKLDRADENFPSTAIWKDGTREFSSRNKYVYLYTKVIDQFLQNAFGKDQFTFARAAMHRSQPYLSALWGGDSRSTWDGLRCQVINALRSGYMGFPVWGSDVGGYLNSANQGHIPKALYARWLEFGAWSGLFEIKIDNAGGNGKDRPPWVYDEELQQIFRESCQTRMDLLPYIYSNVNTASKNGVAMQPLFYAFPGDDATRDIVDEYMFGHAFLVAPFVAPANRRQVYLPKGTWFDYYNLKPVPGGRTIQVDMPLDRIPVFVRANSIYVTGSVLAGNSKNWQKLDKKIIIHAFPGQVGENTSFDFVDSFDNDHEKLIQLSRATDQLVMQSDPLALGGQVIVRVDAKPTKVVLNDRKASFKYDKTNGTVRLKFPANEKLRLVIQ
ncbi:MAG: glycoside hydrolase family 31 protein [Calditrichaeota bacterium]|nr:glycoside hydrolase family 31 protein [Calditrichota bacterium]